jgi:hypothetical protein
VTIAVGPMELSGQTVAYIDTHLSMLPPAYYRIKRRAGLSVCCPWHTYVGLRLLATDAEVAAFMLGGAAALEGLK